MILGGMFMKRKVVAGFVGCMLLSSVGFAAPVVDLNKGESTIGYHYQDFDDHDSNGFSAQTALTDKLVLGAEYSKIDDIDFKTTDIYGAYQLDKNLSVVLGNRHYDVPGDNDDQVLYGLKGSTTLGKKSTGYASVLLTDDETEWQVGATYDVAKNVIFDANYKKRDFDDLSDTDGLGFGLTYKF
jgi:opacity protein-like surface antigen